jgi:hypothetical protein
MLSKIKTRQNVYSVPAKTTISRMVAIGLRCPEQKTGQNTARFNCAAFPQRIEPSTSQELPRIRPDVLLASNLTRVYTMSAPCLLSIFVSET